MDRIISLHELSLLGNLEIVKLYLEKHNPSIEEKNKSLKKSVKKGFLNIFKYLIENGADIHTDNDYAFKKSVKKGYFNIFKYLIENGVDIHTDNDYALRTSVKKGRGKFIEYLSNNGVKVEQDKQINFCFLRHGISCQQFARSNTKGPEFSKLFKKFMDPTISDLGVENSIKAGKDLEKILTIGKFQNTDFTPIESFDIIGSSPMLRAIETAHFITSETYKPNDIFVFPYLRECYICNNKDTVDFLDNSWPMKSIEKQKKYLNDIKINNINFKYVENDLKGREDPGDIPTFIKWFSKNVKLPNKNIVNVLVLIHSGVINAISEVGPRNNAGFVMTTNYNPTTQKIKYDKKNIMGVWPTNISKEIKCPSVRCEGVC